MVLRRDSDTVAMQCQGITKKGVRCRNEIADGYCRFHESQANSEVASRLEHSMQVERIAKEGYIYTYSVKRFLDAKHDSPLKVRNLPNSKEKYRDKWRDFDSKASPYMLVKIGMTTQTVEKRLKQWEGKCHHKLCGLTPKGYFDVTSDGKDEGYGKLYSFKDSKPIHDNAGNKKNIRLLVSALKTLTLSSKKRPEAHYDTYVPTNFGFYCKYVGKAETEIHKRIKRIYGHGDVLCTGCADSDEIFRKRDRPIPSSFKGNYNIHCEWFLIPAQRLDAVFKIIDQVCSKYNSLY